VKIAGRQANQSLGKTTLVCFAASAIVIDLAAYCLLASGHPLVAFCALAGAFGLSCVAVFGGRKSGSVWALDLGIIALIGAAPIVLVAIAPLLLFLSGLLQVVFR
jgi:hypothetical protein